jgi:hypothetical protein
MQLNENSAANEVKLDRNSLSEIVCRDWNSVDCVVKPPTCKNQAQDTWPRAQALDNMYRSKGWRGFMSNFVGTWKWRVNNDHTVFLWAWLRLTVGIVIREKNIGPKTNMNKRVRWECYYDLDIAHATWNCHKTRQLFHLFIFQDFY